MQRCGNTTACIRVFSQKASMERFITGKGNGEFCYQEV